MNHDVSVRIVFSDRDNEMIIIPCCRKHGSEMVELIREDIAARKHTKEK